MLARNPLHAPDAWTEITDGKSDLIHDGKAVGTVYRSYGRWYPQIVPAGARSPTTRFDLDRDGYESRLAAQVRVQDAVEALDADPMTLDALLSGVRPTLGLGPYREPQHEGRLLKTQLV